MPHFQKLFDHRFVGSWDFEGGEQEVEIERLAQEEVHNQNRQEGEPDKVHKWVVYFKGCQKGLVLNKTNATAIANLHGSDYEKWPGQKVTLYKAKTKAFGKPVDCVRVKDHQSFRMDK